MTIKISILILTLTLVWIQVFGQQMYFRIEGQKFINHQSNTEFGKIGAVNFGITKPGFEPGQVSLDYNDYIQRFKYLDVLGINVVRVYSLLQPGFYQALLDWNKEHPTKVIYVLHGTAFPELEMEHNNGTSAYDSHITELMEYYIQTTVQGVYGGGKVTYRYDYSHGGKESVVGDYKYNIAPYLLGWIISGEISPQCIYKTNADSSRISFYQGTYFSSKKFTIQEASDMAKLNNCSSRQQPNGFETWVAKMFDLLATESIKYGHIAPVSHTNWVTTDGICHAIEPRVNDTEYGSVEDWQEFDLHYITPTNNWPAGMYFNQHAYPYYPEMLKINGNNSFIDYMQTIRKYYEDRPLIITEFGLPTSIGVSSVDRVYNRHHGHNGETDQGNMMYELMTTLINEINMDGVVVFQLYDEWFKKSWNTLKYDINRQKWKNMLTSEQYFGILNVESHPDYMKSQKKMENDYYSVDIHNNYEYVEIQIDLKKYQIIPEGDQINIGIDMFPGGVKLIECFKSNYGLWLQPWTFPTLQGSEFENFWETNSDIRDVCFKTSCESLNEYKKITTFDDYKLLVKVPTNGTWVDPNCIDGQVRTGQNINIPIDGINKCEIKQREGSDRFDTIYDAHIYTVQFQSLEQANDDNLALIDRKNGTIKLKIPYQILGFSDPSSHIKTFFEGLGKEFQIIHREYREDINFEISYSMANIQYENSKIVTPFNWNDWHIPEYWIAKPKKSFNAFRMAFHQINFGITPTNLTQEELNGFIYYNKHLEQGGFNIHQYIVKGAIFTLLIIFLSASIGKLLFKDLVYCYSSKQITIGSYRMIFYNFMAAISLGVYLYMDIPVSFVITTPVYFIYLLLVMWDSIILLGLVLFNKWDLYEKITEEYDTKEHAFVIACHNSSDVLKATLKSLLSKVPGSQIYVADNGSTKKEQELSEKICNELDSQIHYGHITFETTIKGKTVKRGNKTMAQYAAICHLNEEVKYVTCIDDDTRLHETWDVNKVLKYFKDDQDVAVLAYPLTADDPQHDIEWFQAMEYLIAGFFKIFHSKVYSTIFNSGAFGTYRVDIVKEALLYHNTDYHGDDLQICMNIHQLKGKKFRNSDKKHTQNYKVKTATNMVGTTIVPKCWLHLSSISRCFKNNCDCGNPDLLQQRSKGWFVSKHRFIPKYIQLILNINGVHGLWVRMVAFYELVIILNEYFAIFYIIFFMKSIGWWLFEGFIIGYTFTVIVMILFDFRVLQPNKQYIPYEFITMQPLVYKLFMITIYRYMGLFYNLFIYSIQHKSGKKIKNRLEDNTFQATIDDMYNHDENQEQGEPSVTIEIIRDIESPSGESFQSFEDIIKDRTLKVKINGIETNV
jgi:hypothetical protein